MNKIETSLTIDNDTTQRTYQSGFVFKNLEEFNKLFEVMRLSFINTIEMNIDNSKKE